VTSGHLEHICYLKKHIYAKDFINHPNIHYKRISVFIPSFFDRYILKQDFNSDILIVNQRRRKTWKGCYANYAVRPNPVANAATNADTNAD
jgi:hypothetical protein